MEIDHVVCGPFQMLIIAQYICQELHTCHLHVGQQYILKLRDWPAVMLCCC